MRSIELIKVAAAAEAMVLRRGAEGVARRSLLLGAAALFGLIMLGLLHAAAWMMLADAQGALAAALWLSALDAVAMTVLLLLARPRHDPVAAEALRLRGRALAGIGQVSPLLEALIGPLVTVVLRRIGGR